MSWAHFLTVEKQQRVKRLTRQVGKVLRIYPRVSRDLSDLGKKIPEQNVFPSFKQRNDLGWQLFKHV